MKTAQGSKIASIATAATIAIGARNKAAATFSQDCTIDLGRAPCCVAFNQTVNAIATAKMRTNEIASAQPVANQVSERSILVNPSFRAEPGTMIATRKPL